MLDCLAECEGVEDYKIICCVEPVNSIIPDLIKSHPLNVELVVNDRLLGLWENKKKALRLGFNESDYVIHLEDDILLSRDGLRFFEFCEQLKNDERIFNVSGYNKGDEPFPEEWLNDDAKRKVDIRQWYTPWAFATWLDRWETFCTNWDGQDLSLNNIRGERFEAYSVLSRVQNIGYCKGEYTSKASRMWLSKIKSGFGDGLVTSISVNDQRRLCDIQDDSLWLGGGGKFPNDCEFIKLNDDLLKLKYSEHYKNHSVKFWAQDYNLENTDFYFDEEMGVGL